MGRETGEEGSTMQRRTFVKRAVAGAGAMALGVLPGAAAAQEGAGEVNVYSARHYDTDDRLYAEFTAQTGVKVNLIDGTDDQLLARIQSEGANSPADVLITVDAGRLWRAEQAGLFQPVASEVLSSRVPANLRHPEGYWFGLAKRARVVAYAKDRVAPAELSTYEALTDSRWRRRLLVRSSSNVYNQSLVGSLIEANGLDATQGWARGIVANMARSPQGADTDQLLAVAAGVGDVAVSNHYYFARLLKSENPADRAAAAKLALHFPAQADGQRGTHVNISGAGVVATAPHRAAAVAFLEYLTGDAAQAVFARGSLEFPVVEGTEVDRCWAPGGPFKEDQLNAATFGYNGRGALFLMDRAGWR
jgi:iron(III) transport system substrate-binding protein